jgi:hypothetical protein
MAAVQRVGNGKNSPEGTFKNSCLAVILRLLILFICLAVILRLLIFFICFEALFLTFEYFPGQTTV